MSSFVSYRCMGQFPWGLGGAAAAVVRLYVQIQNVNTYTRTQQAKQTNDTQEHRATRGDTEASSKAGGERQPLPIIRESGAPCQRPAQTAGDRGGAPCSLPYSGGNNPRDSASKQASAHHNSRATSTRTATHAHHHQPHHTRWVSVDRSGVAHSRQPPR